eukprot:CAMPEP_0184385204 /NCGR_PEP_ID=MMETSP0007-20130409/8611_1 /TAXON_ID=97485 /ORGANISM="Prymnesium parvum, Strain Texoma1" /LENGTH=56 /DNA_ID=CAMNT_0026732427 /DNA_START=105 /DNA_END=270 /DNA_ORIENTATION=-
MQAIVELDSIMAVELDGILAHDLLVEDVAPLQAQVGNEAGADTPQLKLRTTRRDAG